jgi:ribosomal protein S18 acetylase RimI-like enzyme
MVGNIVESEIGLIELSRADSGDLEKVLNLWLEAAHWIQSKGIDQWRPDSFTIESVDKQFAENELFIAMHQDKLIGCFSIQWQDKFFWKEQENNQSGYVHRLAISRSYSGKGLGKLLLDWAGQHIKANGKTYIRLDCMTDNESLNNYYKGLGFQSRGRSDGDNWSANLYERDV